MNNLNGANKFYKYDFTFDNCTTRLRDLLEKTADTTIAFGNVLSKKRGSGNSFMSTSIIMITNGAN